MKIQPRYSKQELREITAAKVASAQETLLKQVEAIQSGEDWQNFLQFQANLHNYSPNNVMLINAQHQDAYMKGLVESPYPSYVAGFNTWRSLGRTVKKGQHGYSILAPCRYDRSVAIDSEGAVRTLGKSETASADEKVERQQVLRGFKVEYVFEVSQTFGSDIPEPPRPLLLRGEAPIGLGASVLSLIEDRGYRVDTVPGARDLAGANGTTDVAARTVLVRADLDDAAMVKTLIHEAAHIMLHTSIEGMNLPRPLQEIEAESVAYVVAYAHGMATDTYSFPYVATWAAGDGAKAVQATQQRVASASKEIIEGSPSIHLAGGRAPGSELVVERAERRRNQALQTTSVGAELPQAVDL